MHSVKARIISITIVILIAAGIIGIAASDRMIRQKDVDEPTEEVSHVIGKDTIHIWYTDEALTDYLNYAAVGYSSVNDDVRVVPVLVSGHEYLESISDASMTDEEMPDMYIAANDTLEKAHLAGLAEPVSPPDNVDITDVFQKTSINAVTYKGNLIAYPLYMECSALCINSDYLDEWARSAIEAEIRAQMAEDKAASDTDEEAAEDTVRDMVSDEDVSAYVSDNAPDTIERLLALSNNYDAPENVDTIFKWAVTDIFYNYFFIGDSINVGGPYGDDTDIIDIYNEDAIRGLSAYQDLNRFFSISTDDVNYSGVIGDFEAGRILMAIVTTDAVRTLSDAANDGTMEYDYRFLPLPDISDAVPARSMSVTDAVVINGYSSMKSAANDFAYYLSTFDAATLYEWTGKVSVLDKADYGVHDDEIQVFVREYDRSVPLPKMLETSNYWVNLEMLFASVWDGADANEGLKSLSEQMKLQVTGERISEEKIIIPDEEPEEDDIIEEESGN